jgi:hypothetical protein
MPQNISVHRLNGSRTIVDLDQCTPLLLPTRDLIGKIAPDGHLSENVDSAQAWLGVWLGRHHPDVLGGCEPIIQTILGLKGCGSKRKRFTLIFVAARISLLPGRPIYVEVDPSATKPFLGACRMDAQVVRQWTSTIAEREPTKDEIAAWRANKFLGAKLAEIAHECGVNQGTISRRIKRVDKWISGGGEVPKPSI